MPTTDKEKRREICRRYWLNNKEKATKATRKWQAENVERCRENKRAWRKKNPDKRKEEFQRWMNKDPERAKEMFRGYARNRRMTINGNLVNRITPAMARSLREGKQGRTWESLVGYTLTELKDRLEKQFLEGMNWDNRHLWHIDHIIPKTAFNFEKTGDIDFKRCWALGNLRPIWKLDNISKKDKIIRPFQPSLLIETGGPSHV